MNYNTNQRKSINNFGLLGGLAAVASYSLGSLYGCSKPEEKKVEVSKECEPDTDRRFEALNGLVAEKNKEKEIMRNYLENLETKISPGIVSKEKNGKNDGIVFIKYKISDKELSDQKIVEVLEEGLVRGKELSRNNFEAYSTSNEWIDSIKEEEGFYDSIPINISGTSTISNGTVTTGTATLKSDITLGDFKTETRYINKTPVLVVDFKEERVLGLYEINEKKDDGIIKFVENKNNETKNLNNLLNTNMYTHFENLQNSVKEIFGAGIYGSIQETEEQLNKVGNSNKYLFDVKVDINSARDRSEKLNNNKISLVTLNQIITGEFTRVEFDGEELKNRFPRFIGSKNRSYCLELFIDKGGKPQSKIITK